MKIDLTSLFFNAKLDTPGGTASWGTSLGQSAARGYPISVPGAQEIYNFIKSQEVSEKYIAAKFKGHNSILSCGLIRKCFLNEHEISSPLIIVIIEEHGLNHNGRKSVKYNPDFEFFDGKDKFSNNNFYQEARNLFGEASCWFAYEMEVKDDCLQINAMKVSDKPVSYSDAAKRKMEWSNLLNDKREEPSNVNLGRNQVFNLFDFIEDLEICSNVSLSETLFRRYIFALLAKKFLILCGNSGSGKSKIATLFADWIDNESTESSSRKAFVAVGADWTDNRHVLGFANTLRSEKHEVDGESVKAPVYQATEILKLILKAHGNPQLPYFLILDEMNLSHVERYFSDFLAHLESPDEPMRLHHLEKCLIHIEENHQSVSENESENTPNSVDADEDDESTSPPQNAGKWRLLDQTIKLPPNLFVIGTVNVDETTYMFSPKVLDRANVIECRTTIDDLKKAAERLFASSPSDSEPEKAPEGTAQAFLELALKARDHKWTESDPNPKAECSKEWKAFVDALHDISQQILEPAGLELTYRPQKEILAYARVDYYFHREGVAATAAAPDEAADGAETEEPESAESEAPDGEGESEVEAAGENATASTASGGWDWKRCLDEQIMQKILPKLTGNERKLRDVLGKLKDFCEKNLLTEADKARVAEKREREPGDRNLSHAKILQMQRRLETDRFTGYF
jgi:MoxR-like ATPase